MTETAASPRQTLSYLRSMFQAHGIHPKNKLGQNFLIDLNLVDRDDKPFIASLPRKSLSRGHGYVTIRSRGVGTEPGRESGIVSFSRANLQLFSRFSRSDFDFTKAAVRREICGLIGNGVPAA